MYLKVARWRVVTLAVLLLAPFLAATGLGFYYVWLSGLGWWFTAPMLLSLSLGWFLAYRWQVQRKLLRVPLEDVPMHWTDRDKEAWKLVEARAKGVDRIDAEQLSDFKFYTTTAQDMALELARFYHPKAKDPVGQLTVPEMLAVVELVAHDMADLVEQYLPAGHLLTVNDWKKAKQALDWYPTLNNVYWAVSAVFAPYNTAVRYMASRLGMGVPLQMLQQNLYVWFYTAYLHRLGTYLIDLNSGRLRVGAARYRQLMEAAARQEQLTGAKPATTPATAEPVAPVTPALPEAVTVTLMGQVKAGKSSLINALLGERRAVTNVLPETAEITRYALQPVDSPSKLVVLDTVGYGHEGPKADQLAATEKASQQSDLLLLVLHARNPARQADLKMLQGLRQWFARVPNLKQPRILAVLTHIDLLSPAMEWQPPYNWQQPTRPKEKNIEQAVATVREQLGEFLVGVVPVCTAEGRVYGIQEELIPAVVELLGESRAVALLRCLHAEADMRKVRKVFDQTLAAAQQLLKALWIPKEAAAPGK